MKIIPVHFPEKYLEALDSLVEQEVYPNRSEAIRMAIRDMLKAESRHFSRKR